MTKTESHNDVAALAVAVRRLSLKMTTRAGSGHPTSCLSAADVMTFLFFGGVLRYDSPHPRALHNDRVIFSKGHASALFYALWGLAGAYDCADAIARYRVFGSPYQGHPMMDFPFTEAPTGSLGQGLSVGAGLAEGLRRRKSAGHVFVLLGDGECDEGQVWEAADWSAQKQLGNMIAIVDANRLAQVGAVSEGSRSQRLAEKFTAFGWHVISCDGHDMTAIAAAFEDAMAERRVPVVIIAQTVKGKGVPFLENKPQWHGKALTQEECIHALAAIGGDESVRGVITMPENCVESLDDGVQEAFVFDPDEFSFQEGAVVSLRETCGAVIAKAAEDNRRLIVLDAGVGNSTGTIHTAQRAPEQFLQLSIAEQNMVSVAVGLWRAGFVPIIATFGAFLTRAHDQLRMAALAGARMIIIGTHAGVSVGEDGPSQMGLDDTAMMRGLCTPVPVLVCEPFDARAVVSCMRRAFSYEGMTYLRLPRLSLPVLSALEREDDACGVRTFLANTTSCADVIVFASGVSLHVALQAQKICRERSVPVDVVTLLTCHPLPVREIRAAIGRASRCIIVEDHVSAGGLGEAIARVLMQAGYAGTLTALSVDHPPRSGSAEENQKDQQIDAAAIAAACCKKN